MLASNAEPQDIAIAALETTQAACVLALARVHRLQQSTWRRARGELEQLVALGARVEDLLASGAEALGAGDAASAELEWARALVLAHRLRLKAEAVETAAQAASAPLGA